MADDDKSLRKAVAAAAATAIVTILVSNWIPNAFKSFYEWLKQEPVLIVKVYDNGQPVRGVSFAVSNGASDTALASGETDEFGVVRLRNVSTGLLNLEALLHEGPNIRRYHDFHRIDSLPHVITLEKNQQFRLTAVTPPGRAPDPTPATAASPSGSASQTTTPASEYVVEVQYGKPLLTSDRAVRARLEIDWVEGTPLPALEVSTSNGVLRVVDLFREVGIELEIVKSNQLPASVLGADRAFNHQELNDTMDTYWNATQDGKWHFYLVVGPKSVTQTGSFIFDLEGRRGAVVLTEYGKEYGVGDDKYSDPRILTFELIHEIGHMLNLPHPWQAYGDTKSVMSSPYRWTDWSWDDPRVYRFDDFGRRHIRRAPDEYVMPGGSAFLDYGAPLRWSSVVATQ